MKIQKINILLISTVLIFGCAKKEETSEDPTDITSYVGKWVKSSNNAIAMDWKSDNFIYGCLVGTYTYAAHGS